MTTSVLTNIQLQITRIGYPICIFIGNIAGAIGLFVFLQKTMRRNPCGLILIFYMITNILYVNFTILVSALDALFKISPILQSSTFCRIYFYLSFVLAVIPPYLLSMASIDRSFASSRNVHIRLRSTQRFAKLMIIIICVFWIIFHSHAFFIVDIQIINNVQLICTFFQGSPATFVTYYNLICIGIIPLSLMIGFGIQILININRTGVRLNGINNNRRLIILLIIQVTVYLCLRLPASAFLIYKEITKSDVKSADRFIVEQFVQTVVYFCQFIQISASPLLNLITTTFRKELKQAWNKIRGRRNQLDVSNSRQMRVITRP